MPSNLAPTRQLIWFPFRNVTVLTTHPDKAQDSAYPEDPHHAQQRGRHGEVRHEVLHHDADDGGDHQHEVEQVPGRGEVVVPQTDDLDGGLCKN